MPNQLQTQVATIGAIALRPVAVGVLLAAWLALGPGSAGVAAAGDGLLDNALDELDEPLTPPSETLNESLGAPLMPVVESGEQIADGAIDTVDGEPSLFGTRLDPALEPTTDALSEALGRVESALAPTTDLLEQQSALLQQAVEPTSELAANRAAAPLSPIIEPVFEPLKPVLKPVLDPLDPVLRPVLDPFDPVLEPLLWTQSVTQVTLGSTPVEEAPPPSTADQTLSSPSERRGEPPAASPRPAARAFVAGRSAAADRPDSIATDDLVMFHLVAATGIPAGHHRQVQPTPRDPPAPPHSATSAGASDNASASRIRATSFERGSEHWQRIFTLRPPRHADPILGIPVPPA